MDGGALALPQGIRDAILIQCCREFYIGNTAFLGSVHVKSRDATKNTHAENVKVEPTVSEDVQENEPRNLPTLIDEISGCAERIGKQYEADDSENSQV